MRETRLDASRGTIVFGEGEWILHKLLLGAPKLVGGMPGVRTVEIGGYILPVGEDRRTRAESMERARHLICRIAADAAGFTLTHDGRTLHLIATRAPEFSAQAPLTGEDAAYFTLTAEAEHGAFGAGEVTIVGRGRVGAMRFPLAITEKTVLGALSPSGVMMVDNPGDLPSGFVLRVAAEGGEITKCTIRCGASMLAVTHTIQDGEEITFDTRTGAKNIFAGASSILADADAKSTFFALPPGESALYWAVEGDGNAALRLEFAPQYL